jgi:hypothetical protein
MRRTALTVLLFAALAAPAQAAPPAKVSLTSCVPSQRVAQFEARMGAVKEATRLRMKFTLQARDADQSTYHRIAAPGFRNWTTAGKGKTSWVFTRRVEGLLGPARYRAVVRFQWRDLHGKVIAHAKKTSRACRQPDHRPNLKIKSLTHLTRHRYDAVVVNNGITASGPFELQLAIGNKLLDPVSVAAIAPHAQRVVALHGQNCKPGVALTVTADPLNLVDERNELDNVFTKPCA